MEDAERAVTFVYHLALCALNTSLVSGAMAERWLARHEICQKIYTAIFSGQRFYTFNFTEFQQLQ